MKACEISTNAKDFFKLSGSLGGVTLKASIISSAAQFQDLRSLTAMALLIATQVVLGLFSLNVMQGLRIGFGFLPQCVAGMLFGPLPAAACAAIADIISYLAKPTGPFFPGFTITAALSGFVYGLAFYRRNIGLFSIAAGKLAVNILVFTLINSLNLQILYGNLTLILFWQRALKNVIAWPIETLLLCAVLPAVYRAYVVIRRP